MQFENMLVASVEDKAGGAVVDVVQFPFAGRLKHPKSTFLVSFLFDSQLKALGIFAGQYIQEEFFRLGFDQVVVKAGVYHPSKL